MLRWPERSRINAALTPSSAVEPSAQMAPDVVGRPPAIARSSVLLPEPLCPMTPIDSPWEATNEMPRTALTTSTAPTWRRTLPSHDGPVSRRPPKVR